MRPHAKTRSKGAAQGRLRWLLTGGLGWLRAFPVRTDGRRILWMVVPPLGSAHAPETIEVDGERLRQATVVWKTALATSSGRCRSSSAGTSSWRGFALAAEP